MTYKITAEAYGYSLRLVYSGIYNWSPSTTLPRVSGSRGIGWRGESVCLTGGWKGAERGAGSCQPAAIVNVLFPGRQIFSQLGLWASSRLCVWKHQVTASVFLHRMNVQDCSLCTRKILYLSGWKRSFSESSLQENNSEWYISKLSDTSYHYHRYLGFYLFN